MIVSTSCSIETSTVVAASENIGHGPFVVLSATKNNHVWCAVVEKTSAGWTNNSANLNSNALPTSPAPKAIFAGSHVPKEFLLAFEEKQIPVLRPNPTAHGLLDVATSCYRLSQFTEPGDVNPLYPREPEAVRLWKTKNP